MCFDFFFRILHKILSSNTRADLPALRSNAVACNRGNLEKELHSEPLCETNGGRGAEAKANGWQSIAKMRFVRDSF